MNLALKSSKWDEAEAKRFIDLFGAAPGGEDLALRVYSTRLLGLDPSLVLHGGGNTSVKTRVVDFDRQSVAVLCVKGSGWDMGVWLMAPPKN